MGHFEDRPDRGIHLGEGLDGENHAIHEFEFLLLREAALLGPSPLLVVDAGSTAVENVKCVDRHF
jgi:hypothetical protein